MGFSLIRSFVRSSVYNIIKPTTTMMNNAMIAAVSLMACFQEISASTFGFRTCSEKIGSRHGVSKDGNFAIDYQIGFDRYECLIDGAPKHDTVYTCESVPYDRCFGGDFFQISNDGNDDMSFCSIIFDGKEIELASQLGRQQIGNNFETHNQGTFKRRYDIDSHGRVIATPSEKRMFIIWRLLLRHFIFFLQIMLCIVIHCCDLKLNNFYMLVSFVFCI